MTTEPGSRGEKTVNSGLPLLLPIVVRPMRVEDIPDVMDIERCSFPSPWPESAYHYELRYRTDSRYLVVVQRKEEERIPSWRERLMGGQGSTRPRLLGYVGLRLRGDTAHIATIAVHPDWRGRGLGEYLLLTAVEEGLRWRVRWVTLEVRASNHVAQSLYHKAGFVRTGLRPGYYSDGEDAWLMRLGPLEAETIVNLERLRRKVLERLTTDHGPRTT